MISKRSPGRTRITVLATVLFFLPVLSGCAFFLGNLVGIGAGTVAGAVTKSHTTGTAAGAVAGAGGGALAGYAVGGR